MFRYVSFLLLDAVDLCCIKGCLDNFDIASILIPNNKVFCSNVFSAWLMQILLSELLGVPTTIETSTTDADGSINFYDPTLGFTYSPTTWVRCITVCILLCQPSLHLFVELTFAFNTRLPT